LLNLVLLGREMVLDCAVMAVAEVLRVKRVVLFDAM
jgi:hypothetical protein